MSFAEEMAKKLVQERADATKLDQFIRENPRMHERLTAMSKDELIRRLMSEKMGRTETVVRRNRELEQWVDENPEIVSKVEERLKILADENRKRAAIKTTQTQKESQG